MKGYVKVAGQGITATFLFVAQLVQLVENAKHRTHVNAWQTLEGILARNLDVVVLLPQKEHVR